MKRCTSSLLCAILLTLSLASALGNFSFAQTTTIVAVTNPLTGDSNFRFSSNTTSVDDTFIADIAVTNVVDLYAWDVLLYFDNTQVNISSTADIFQPADHVFAGNPTVDLLVNLDSTLGHVEFAQSLLGNVPSFNGSGRLAQIRFKIIKSPPTLGSVFSYLAINNTGTFLLNSDLNDIPAVKTDGYYEYAWAPPPSLPWLEVAPTLVEYGPYPPSAIGKHFNITVWLKGLEAAWKLANVTCGLTYNSTLIQSIDATEGPFMKQFATTKFSKSIGTNRVDITVGLSSPPTIYPNGEGAIATIQFNIVYQGTTVEVKESPLILVGMKLTDKNKKVIPLDSTKILDGTYRIKSLTPSTINLIVAPNTVTAGSNVTITGGITPPRAQVNVTIYYRLEGQSWTILTIARTNSDGTYTFDWNAVDAGSYQLKTVWPGDMTTLSDESDVKNVKVESTQAPSLALLDILPYALIAIIIITLVAVGIYYWKIRKPAQPK